MNEVPASPASAPRPSPATATCALSVVVPIYNEEESIGPLYGRLTSVLADGPTTYRNAYELILVDDGSTDSSFRLARDLQRRDRRVGVIEFRRNFGKTAALHAGFRQARGARIVTIDADMQEDPADMFRLLAELDRGYDLVSAWRKERNDPHSKTIPSRVFNAVVARLTAANLHDFNCGFKAYRCEVVHDLPLYGELHRFIPVLAIQRGFRVGEVAVRHQRRRFGKSKFGTGRLLSGYLDLLQVLFLTTYMRRPLRLFGTVGTLVMGLGGLICLYLTVLWFLGNRPIGDRPLLILGVLLIITGLQFISMGLVGEMVRHNSHARSQTNDEYAVRSILAAEPICIGEQIE